MRCPHCGRETNSDDVAPVADLFAPPRPDGVLGNTKRSKTATRLQPDWQPDAKQRHYAELQGKEPDAFATAFVEYYVSKGTRWLDWNKVWEKACREWKGHVEAPKAPPERETPRERELSQWRARLSSKVWNAFWGPKIGEPGCQVPRELLPSSR